MLDEFFSGRMGELGTGGSLLLHAPPPERGGFGIGELLNRKSGNDPIKGSRGWWERRGEHVARKLQRLT